MKVHEVKHKVNFFKNWLRNVIEYRIENVLIKCANDICVFGHLVNCPYKQSNIRKQNDSLNEHPQGVVQERNPNPCWE